MMIADVRPGRMYLVGDISGGCSLRTCIATIVVPRRKELERRVLWWVHRTTHVSLQIEASGLLEYGYNLHQDWDALREA